VGGPQFHLSYDAEEDRLLLAVDVTAERRYAMALTRRLVKLVLGGLADLHAKSHAAKAIADPQLRDTMLNFEHAQAVAQNLASGDIRTHQPTKPLVEPARLVREIKLTPRNDGGIVISCDDKARVLTLDLEPSRVHSFMAGVIDLATGAAWDLPVVATWLDRARATDTSTARVMH
jgi:hypothetical protein